MENKKFVKRLFYVFSTLLITFCITGFSASAESTTEGTFDVIEKDCNEVVVCHDLTIETTDDEVTTLEEAMGEYDLYVSGTLQWTDNHNINHPLRKIAVRIYDRRVGLDDVLLATTYTGDNGQFTYHLTGLGFNQNDIYVEVSAGDGNISVQDGVTGAYKYVFDVKEASNWGETLYFNRTFKMDGTTDKSNETIDENIPQAFQIFEALVVARDYAAAMDGELPIQAAAIYPYVHEDSSEHGCCYSHYNDDEGNLILGLILITKHRSYESNPWTYECWDVIMHEYGHHIQQQKGFSGEISEQHDSSENNADANHDKEIGVLLAWQESWPTVFGTMAQQYYSSYLSGIATVTDTSYTSYNNLNYDIETTPIALGEACEKSIMAVLWDIFDNTPSEDNDSIFLGHQAFWNITTEHNALTFSAFIEDFYSAYPEYIYKLAENLDFYQMASSSAILLNEEDIDFEEPPTIYWLRQGGSGIFPNNSFTVVFYNELGEEIHRESTGSHALYTMPIDLWQDIIYSGDSTYSVAIMASQSASPVTGPYYSPKVSFSISQPVTTVRYISVSSLDKYKEDVIGLQAGHCVEYHITFATGGRKLLQTFGTKDSKMTLMDAYGNIISVNDSGGYEENALFHRVFEANTEYIVRIEFYGENASGNVKFAITPTYDNGKTSGEMIENYYNIKNRTVTVSVPCDFTQGYTTVFTFTPSETGTYNFKITYDLGTVIYVIDPRSAEEGVNTGLYSGTSLRLVPLPTEICFHLDAGIRYLVIYAPSNINSNYQDGGLLTVNPDILNPTVPLGMPEAPYGEEDEAA